MTAARARAAVSQLRSSRAFSAAMQQQLQLQRARTRRARAMQRAHEGRDPAGCRTMTNDQEASMQEEPLGHEALEPEPIDSEPEHVDPTEPMTIEPGEAEPQESKLWTPVRDAVDPLVELIKSAGAGDHVADPHYEQPEWGAPEESALTAVGAVRFHAGPCWTGRELVRGAVLENRRARRKQANRALRTRWALTRRRLVSEERRARPGLYAS
jgi:hypothetical protein